MLSNTISYKTVMHRQLKVSHFDYLFFSAHRTSEAFGVFGKPDWIIFRFFYGTEITDFTFKVFTLATDLAKSAIYSNIDFTISRFFKV